MAFKGSKLLKGVAAVLATGVVAAGALVGLVLYGSRNTLSRFDAFAGAHAVGTSVEALFEDPFFLKVAEVSFSGAFAGRAGGLMEEASPVHTLVSRFRADPVSRDGAGSIELMWVYLPPFGRVFFSAEYERGVIRKTRVSSLD